MEGLEIVQSSDIKKKCPAFKDGCPFATVEEKHLIEEIKNCPEFKSGCPFEDAKSLAEVYEKLSHVPHSAGHESELSGQKLIEMFKKIHDTSECLEEKLGDCPVFHKEQGCPFKSVRSCEGKHLVEPASSVVSPIRESVPSNPSKRKVMTTGVSDMKEICPAFQPSCPFSNVANNSGSFKSAMKCPKFKEGCAFKDCKSISDIYIKLKEIPNLEEEQGSHGEVLESLKMVHDLCVGLEKELGECPIFKTEMGCPFKTVCGDGKLMIAKIEENITSKIIAEGAHQEKLAIEEELLSSSGIALHKELKEKTKKSHKKTNTSPFVRQMVKGNVSVSGYKILLANLYFIYRTLEEEGDKHQSHPKVKPVYFPVELRRTPEIIKDLEYFYGSDWKDEITPLEATARYMARLRQLSKEDPMLLVAHQYTRYLGDLAGGQILKKVFTKTYNLSGSDGVRFYDFENISEIDDFKQLYRSRLDSLDLDRENADRMVNESLKSFQFHIEMFVELADLCGIEPDPGFKVENVAPVYKPSARKPSARAPSTKTIEDTSSSAMQFVRFGVVVTLLAILYSYLLA